MLKTLMPYPRLSYGFSVILQLNTHFYSLISDSCILCEQQVERGVFEIILEQKCIKLAATLRRPNVVTFQRRDVGSTKMEVNKRQTSQRQRDFSITIIKRKRDQNSRTWRYVRTKAQKESDNEPDQWRRQLLL